MHHFLKDSYNINTFNKLDFTEEDPIDGAKHVATVAPCGLNRFLKLWPLSRCPILRGEQKSKGQLILSDYVKCLWLNCQQMLRAFAYAANRYARRLHPLTELVWLVLSRGNCWIRLTRTTSYTRFYLPHTPTVLISTFQHLLRLL